MRPSVGLWCTDLDELWPGDPLVGRGGHCLICHADAELADRPMLRREFFEDDLRLVVEYCCGYRALTVAAVDDEARRTRLLIRAQEEIVAHVPYDGDQKG